MSAAEKYFNVLLMLCRVCIGCVMIYSGVQLLRGEGLLSYSQFDSVITGMFVILLGAYCVVSSVFVRIFEKFQQRYQGRQ